MPLTEAKKVVGKNAMLRRGEAPEGRRQKEKQSMHTTTSRQRGEKRLSDAV